MNTLQPFEQHLKKRLALSPADLLCRRHGTKDISSDDIINGLGPVAFPAQAVGDRDELLARLKADARPEDCLLVMRARDPSLPALVRKVVEMFGGENF
jgi:hypothetical protein